MRQFILIMEDNDGGAWFCHSCCFPSFPKCWLVHVSLWSVIKLDRRLYNAAVFFSDPEAYGHLMVTCVFGSLPRDAHQFGHSHLKSWNLPVYSTVPGGILYMGSLNILRHWEMLLWSILLIQFDPFKTCLLLWQTHGLYSARNWQWQRAQASWRMASIS